jgi:molybdenum cofactor cytidylyltransferase
MKFGEWDIAKAEGAILAHAVRHGGGVFKKGRVLRTTDIETLAAAGVSRVFAARLSPDDVPEDEAADAVARVAGGSGTTAQAPFTGRANLHSSVHGVVVVDWVRVNALNALHESLTAATVANHTVIEPRQMVATIKVIPFAVPRPILERALTLIGNEPLIRVEVFRPYSVGLVITRLPQTKPSLIAKSEAAMRERIAALGGSLGRLIVTGHSIAETRAAIAELHAAKHHPILVFGASAIVDRGDVIPAAVEAAGGDVVHLGMPVDPGNLMMFGRLDGVPVIGVPSCARSPKVNGFDWVLERVMAGIHVSAHDIMAMGAGGLLAEIPTRPSPREAKPKVQKRARVVAIVLAAGKSSRMGANKLLADIGGKAMIRRTVEAIAASAVDFVVVVTGREPDGIATALSGLKVEFVHNHDYAQGLSTSLRVGLAAAGDADAALICLGDMPRVGADAINRLIAAFNPTEHRAICVPVFDGKMGNPVLWSKQYFDEMRKLSGDRGARELLGLYSEDVVEVSMPDDAVLDDIDTPEALARIQDIFLP